MRDRHRPPRRQRDPANESPGLSRIRLAAGLFAFAVLFTAVQLARSGQQSATWDEPMHLTAGYAALTAGDFRIDPSHPPLARVWAAIPLAISGRPLDTRIVDETMPDAWLTRGYAFARDFVSRAGIDRTLLPARAMTVAWGAVLGLLVFAWAFQWMGLRVAVLALVLYALEPNMAAHSGLVTTDAPLTALVFGAVFFLWRYSQRPYNTDLAGLAACVALAAITKFSAILLAPIVGALLVIALFRTQINLRRATLITAVLAATTMLVIWAAYGFRYAPSDNPHWLLTPAAGGSAGMPWPAAVVNWLDAYHLLPNAFAQGFVYGLSSAGEMPAFLAGEVRTGGWWYYFAVALALKTPLAILALGAVGIAALTARRSGHAGLTPAFIAVPIVVWLVAATASGVNLGVRHVLPVYPFLVLLAAAGASVLLARRGLARATVAAMLLVLAVEVGRSEPYPLSFFNALAGGPENGFRYLADSNLGWGGNLKALQRWMDERGVTTINLAFFGSIDPALYGIRATYLPTSATFLTDRFTRPQLPGYVAISGTSLDGVYLPEWWRRFYSGLRDREPAAIVANTMRIYWVDEWPEHSLPISDVESVRTLADALLFGLGWPEHATVHYREYLQRDPGHPGAWNGMAVALAQTGRSQEAIDAFRRVLMLSPADPDARRNIALLQERVRHSARVFPE